MALANVSIKNGNFFIGYTDIVYPGGFETKLERVYNSKTAYKGMFGWGWGTELEVYLTVSSDGSVVMHEYGGGAENRFSPMAFDKAELDKAVAKITEAAQQAGAVGSAEQLGKYKQRLAEDATYRNDEWEKYVAQNKLKRRELKEGAQLFSNRFSYQYLTKVKDGYVRSFDNGRTEKFDESGKLAQVSDKNNNFVKFTYGKDGKLEKIADNFNRKVFFTFNNKGLVSQIQGENGKSGMYEYNDLDELSKSKDVDGNSYKYTYSDDRRHNLKMIGYSDKTSMEISYYPRDQHENVKSVKDRDSTTTEYNYDIDKSVRGHFTVGVQVKDQSSKAISKSSYEYHMKYKPTGEEWTYKMMSSVDGDATETTYNECCGLPVIIRRSGQETIFEYDQKGHVTQKSTPTEVTKLSYHPKVGKVTRVEKLSKKDAKAKNWSEFEYDGKGNLVFAKNSEKKGVKLFYDGSGRIISMVDQKKNKIEFKYNENSKPIEIRDPKLGTIKVSYTNSGEIKNVESSAGRKIALQVTSAFQNLLDIIRPAGVNLSFQ